MKLRAVALIYLVREEMLWLASSVSYFSLELLGASPSKNKMFINLNHSVPKSPLANDSRSV